MLSLTKNRENAHQLQSDSTSLPSGWPAIQTDQKTAGAVAGSACYVGTGFQTCGVKRSGAEGVVGSHRPHPQGAGCSGTIAVSSSVRKMGPHTAQHRGPGLSGFLRTGSLGASLLVDKCHLNFVVFNKHSCL